MKVLVQAWEIDRGYQFSISRDRTQLDKTIIRLKKKDAGEPRDTPREIEIPDDHALAKIVERDTVFVIEDEEEATAYLH